MPLKTQDIHASAGQVGAGGGPHAANPDDDHLVMRHVQQQLRSMS